MAYASCARSSAVFVTSCRPAARRHAARSADMPMAGPGPGTALMVAPSQLEARVAEGWTLVDIRDERQHANARLKAAAHVPLFVADESQGASVLGRKVRQRGWVGGLRTHARTHTHARPQTGAIAPPSEGCMQQTRVEATGGASATGSSLRGQGKPPLHLCCKSCARCSLRKRRRWRCGAGAAQLAGFPCCSLDVASARRAEQLQAVAGSSLTPALARGILSRVSALLVPCCHPGRLWSSAPSAGGAGRA